MLLQIGIKWLLLRSIYKEPYWYHTTWCSVHSIMHKDFWPWYISICDIDIHSILFSTYHLKFPSSSIFIQWLTWSAYNYAHPFHIWSAWPKSITCFSVVLKLREKKHTKTEFQILILFPYQIWSKWNAFQGFKWQYFMIQVIMLNHFYSFVKMKSHDVQTYSFISKNRKIYLVFSSFPFFAHGSF